MKLKLLLTFILMIAASPSTVAEIFFDQNSTARALGMGNAFTVMASDSSCLFYNPAGLARVSGINFKLFGLHGGGGSMDDLTKMTDLMDSTKFAQTLNSLYGDNVWINAGGMSAFYMPMFAVGIYNHIDASIKFDNPVYSTIGTRYINDLGYTLGVGVPLGPFVEVGANLRYVRRAGANFDFGPSSLASLDTTEIESAIAAWGRGYAFDFGLNLIIPAPFFTAVVGGVWKNVGETRYKSTMDSQIPYDENVINLGMAFAIDMPLLTITPAIDIKHLGQEDIQFARKINLGIEIGLPLIDIRGGFSEGYYTAGAGIDLGLFQIDAATYGVELGDYPGQIEDRRYMLEFAMELGVGGFSASPNASNSALSSGAGTSANAADGKGSGLSGGQGSGSKSLFGGRRLKRRR